METWFSSNVTYVCFIQEDVVGVIISNRCPCLCHWPWSVSYVRSIYSLMQTGVFVLADVSVRSPWNHLCLLGINILDGLKYYKRIWYNFETNAVMRRKLRFEHMQQSWDSIAPPAGCYTVTCSNFICNNKYFILNVEVLFDDQWFCSAKAIIYFWDDLILHVLFHVVNLNTIQGGLTDISA